MSMMVVFTQIYIDFHFGADTTTDNGWTVGGSFAIEVCSTRYGLIWLFPYI